MGCSILGGWDYRCRFLLTIKNYSKALTNKHWDILERFWLVDGREKGFTSYS